MNSHVTAEVAGLRVQVAPDSHQRCAITDIEDFKGADLLMPAHDAKALVATRKLSSQEGTASASRSLFGVFRQLFIVYTMHMHTKRQFDQDFSRRRNYLRDIRGPNTYDMKREHHDIQHSH